MQRRLSPPIPSGNSWSLYGGSRWFVTLVPIRCWSAEHPGRVRRPAVCLDASEIALSNCERPDCGRAAKADHRVCFRVETRGAHNLRASSALSGGSGCANGSLFERSLSKLWPRIALETFRSRDQGPEADAPDTTGILWPGLSIAP